MASDLKVAVYSKGELGAEMSVIQQIQFGGIDFARVSLSQLAEYMPALNVLQLPFLYQDAGQMWRVLDGSIGDEFLTRLDAIDLTGLSWFDAGVRSFYTRQKVTCLAELQGLRLRVQESDTMSMMVSALGADPVQVVYSQVYAALHNGQIDGAENNWPSYEAMSHYEVAPYFLRDEHTRVPEIQLASIPAMEKMAALDPTFPDILRSCARESALIERTLWAEQEEGAEQEMLARGIVVTELSSEEKQKFRAAVQPLYDQFADQSELIARTVAKELGLPVKRLLKKRRNTRAQSTLTKEQRRANVLGAYVCVNKDAVCGKRVLLIDDVFTTGATAQECAKVLLTAGAKSVACAVVASASKNEE